MPAQKEDRNAVLMSAHALYEVVDTHFGTHAKHAMTRKRRRDSVDESDVQLPALSIRGIEHMVNQCVSAVRSNPPRAECSVTTGESDTCTDTTCSLRLLIATGAVSADLVFDCALSVVDVRPQLLASVLVHTHDLSEAQLVRALSSALERRTNHSDRQDIDTLIDLIIQTPRTDSFICAALQSLSLSCSSRLLSYLRACLAMIAFASTDAIGDFAKSSQANSLMNTPHSNVQDTRLRTFPTTPQLIDWTSNLCDSQLARLAFIGQPSSNPTEAERLAWTEFERAADEIESIYSLIGAVLKPAAVKATQCNAVLRAIQIQSAAVRENPHLHSHMSRPPLTAYAIETIEL